VERIKPKIGDGFAGFGHQALALPGEAEPEAAIVVLFRTQVDAADDLIGAGFQAESSLPSFAALDGGQRHVADVAVGGVGGIGPGDLGGEITNDFPLGEEELQLRGIGKFQRTQEQARRFQGRGRGHARSDLAHS